MSVAATVRSVNTFSTCDIMSATNMPWKITIGGDEMVSPASTVVPPRVRRASQ